MTILQAISAAVNWWVRVNENFAAVSPAALFSKKDSTTTGLTLGYYGGVLDGTNYSDGTHALTASTTRYVVVARATGVVSSATGTTNWNDSTNYLRMGIAVVGASTITSWTDWRQAYGASGGGGGGSTTQCIAIACSDETTALTTGTAKVTFHMPFAMTGVSVKASLTTARSAGSIFTVDVNESGTTILSTKITIDNTEKTSATAATPPVVSDTSLAADAEITVDIDQVGTSGATGLKVYIIGTV